MRIMKKRKAGLLALLAAAVFLLSEAAGFVKPVEALASTLNTPLPDGTVGVEYDKTLYSNNLNDKDRTVGCRIT